MNLAFNPINSAPGVQVIATLDGQNMTITNAGDGIVTAIYFEGGSQPSIPVEDLLDFTTSTATLPGGNLIQFRTDYAFRAVAPPTKHGIQNGESLTFQVANAPTRIGLHVQSIGEAETSASLIATVPEPSTGLLIAGALTILARRRRDWTNARFR